jgi:hypothetical protein
MQSGIRAKQAVRPGKYLGHAGSLSRKADIRPGRKLFRPSRQEFRSGTQAGIQDRQAGRHSGQAASFQGRQVDFQANLAGIQARLSDSRYSGHAVIQERQVVIWAMQAGRAGRHSVLADSYSGEAALRPGRHADRRTFRPGRLAGI